ncbi:bifunctional 5,10-methylenetetrahydrofolate dehydrogenase/5,10-methenyltetrahydrofolate cyclohydrolase [Candidatus Collierbacteria bacterium]|nr:bifunctional 5,10-methylenetetrahydrofolate dehydrogenase/5,10-methenyltetrahydrofolate cyclohydrolase [Candidatus Collierbacteria bacterium]
MFIIDGKKLAAEREQLLKIEVQKLTKKIGRRPRLVAVELSDDEGGRLYLKLKKAAAERVGIEFDVVKRPGLAWQGQALSDTDGIFIQHPRGYNKQKWQELVDQIPPEKDVDCLTSENLRLIKEGNPRFLPATVKAVLYSLEHVFRLERPGLAWQGQALSDALRGKKIVILGRSPILGLPLFWWLKSLGVNVTLFHSQSTISDLRLAVSEADILISSVGKPGLVTGNMVKKGAIVIDCGSPLGDVVFSEVAPKTSAITPVPGGVGPLTVVSLMENVVQSINNAGRESS